MIREEKIEMCLKQLEALEQERTRLLTEIHEHRMMRDIRDGDLTVVDTLTGNPVNIKVVEV